MLKVITASVEKDQKHYDQKLQEVESQKKDNADKIIFNKQKNEQQKKENEEMKRQLQELDAKMELI